MASVMDEFFWILSVDFLAPSVPLNKWQRDTVIMTPENFHSKTHDKIPAKHSLWETESQNPLGGERVEISPK